MWIYIPIALAAVVVVFVGVAALQPSAFRVARTTKISAPPAMVFASSQRFRQMGGLEPWGKIDPSMKLTYEGVWPESGQAIHGPATAMWVKDA